MSRLGDLVEGLEEQAFRLPPQVDVGNLRGMYDALRTAQGIVNRVAMAADKARLASDLGWDGHMSADQLEALRVFKRMAKKLPKVVKGLDATMGHMKGMVVARQDRERKMLGRGATSRWALPGGVFESAPEGRKVATALKAQLSTIESTRGRLQSFEKYLAKAASGQSDADGRGQLEFLERAASRLDDELDMAIRKWRSTAAKFEAAQKAARAA